jgi:hypothetical protein
MNVIILCPIVLLNVSNLPRHCTLGEGRERLVSQDSCLEEVLDDFVLVVVLGLAVVLVPLYPRTFP